MSWSDDQLIIKLVSVISHNFSSPVPVSMCIVGQHSWQRRETAGRLLCYHRGVIGCNSRVIPLPITLWPLYRQSFWNARTCGRMSAPNFLKISSKFELLNAELAKKALFHIFCTIQHFFLQILYIFIATLAHNSAHIFPSEILTTQTNKLLECLYTGNCHWHCNPPTKQVLIEFDRVALLSQTYQHFKKELAGKA